MAVFPSETWFQEVQALYNSDSSLHTGGGGACDTRAAMRIGERHFLIEFSGHECALVEEIPEARISESDFFLEMPPDTWNAMIANIQRNGRAEFGYTLNSIDLDLEEGLAHATGDDQYLQDLFYRYNQNFQDFFDASAHIETTFE